MGIILVPTCVKLKKVKIKQKNVKNVLWIEKNVRKVFLHV